MFEPQTHYCHQVIKYHHQGLIYQVPATYKEDYLDKIDNEELVVRKERENIIQNGIRFEDNLRVLVSLRLLLIVNWVSPPTMIRLS